MKQGQHHRRCVVRYEFRGDNVMLCDCIKALIEMDDANALWPHGIGGHARCLLEACYRRLKNPRRRKRQIDTRTKRERVRA